ncbi:MAG: hypothetical protein ACYTFG_00195 [Planctomycetota bacterium]|jgi:hypothetical protein
MLLMQVPIADLYLLSQQVRFSKSGDRIRRALVGSRSCCYNVRFGVNSARPLEASTTGAKSEFSKFRNQTSHAGPRPSIFLPDGLSPPLYRVSKSYPRKLSL